MSDTSDGSSVLANLTTECPRHTRYVTLGALDELSFTAGRATGAMLVTSSEPGSWGTSTCTRSPGIHVLNVYRWHPDEPNAYGGAGVIERHPTLDGLTFGTAEEANRCAYDAGILRFFFWENDAQAQAV